jgi:hypothetical protein
LPVAAIPAVGGNFRPFASFKSLVSTDLLGSEKGDLSRGGITLVNRLIAWLSILFRSPIFWGGLVSALYFGGIEFGVVRNPFLLRFTAGHFVEHVVTIVFFVGSAALAIKGLQVYAQRKAPGGSLLGPIPFGGQTVDDAKRLAGELDRAPSHLQRGYLLRRLRELLDHVHRTGSERSTVTRWCE